MLRSRVAQAYGTAALASRCRRLPRARPLNLSPFRAVVVLASEFDVADRVRSAAADRDDVVEFQPLLRGADDAAALIPPPHLVSDVLRNWLARACVYDSLFDPNTCA